MSRHWNRARQDNAAPQLTANLAHGADFTAVEKTFTEAAREHPKSQVAGILRRWLPARVGEALLREVNVAGQRELGQLDRDSRRKIVHALTAWPLPVTGTRGYKFAEVTAGGIPLSEINPKTMQSRCCEGLYLVGEILDVDGRIGGFNFQWAWSSAKVVADALARAKEE
jgi:hypothetical protein